MENNVATSKPDQPSFIVVIGASAGGADALGELLVQLSKDMDLAVLIVLHLSAKGVGELLRKRLQRFTQLICELAENDATIKRGHVYLAPPDQHLLVKAGHVRIANGPVENRWRPSIDVLFRSAAVAYGERVIGIVLTGLLDDGTAGMMAIKKCGGICMVQDPEEAEYPYMPLSVLNNMEVDYSVPLAHMGFIVHDITLHKEIKGLPVPGEIQAESEIAERTISGINRVEPLGDRSAYSCPDCGGALWEIDESGFHRYRCHIGHAYSENDLLKRQSEQMESTLWVALRMMEERRNLLGKIGQEEARKGLGTLATIHFGRVTDLEVHIKNLKKLLFESKND